MKSTNIIIKEADFAGFKIVMSGVSVAQAPTIELALSYAKNLDTEASEFDFHSKDKSIKTLKV